MAADRRTPHQLRKQKLRLKAAPSVKIRKTVGAGPRKIRQYASADPDARQEVPQTAGGQLRIRKHTVAHKEDEPNRTKEEKKRSRSASRNNSETEKGDNDLKLTMKGIRSLTTAGLKLTPLSVEQSAMIPRLCHGLDRVLFNPGVYQIQDPRSRVFNFDPFLQKVLPVSEFNFNALQQFETSSQDATLKALAKQRRGVKYYGSTSSMTGILKHFHFLLSQWRTLNFPMLSREFDVKNKRFSQFTKMPAAVFLRYQRGQYALDADKYFDRQNVMSLLGQSLERFLTLPPREYNRYRLSHANRITSEEEASRSNAYNYTAAGSILMRSQLDAYDPRLPGTGVFDVKTRAVVSVRAHSMDSDHSGGMGYEIRERHGQWESFEREMYDLIRNTMLSYSLQARIGRMDGIFMAYHNIERIFGFQYLSMEDLDRALHGQKDPYLGDEEFKLSLKLLQKVLNQITERFPKQVSTK